MDETPEAKWVELSIIYHLRVKLPQEMSVDRLTDKILERSQGPVFNPDRILAWDEGEVEMVANGVREGFQ